MINVTCGLSSSETRDQHRPVQSFGLYGSVLFDANSAGISYLWWDLW